MLTSSTRSMENFTADVPGPNNYTLPPLIGLKNHDARSTIKQGPAFSILGRWRATEQQALTTTPGPVYDLENTFRNGHIDANKGFTIKGKSSAQHVNQLSNTPGPGAYLPDDKAIRRAAPLWTMKFRSQVKHHSNAEELQPSPADYLPQNSFRADWTTAPGYSIRGRGRPSTVNENMPGPASYYPNPHFDRQGELTAPGWSLRSNRPQTSLDSVPAPNAYSPKMSIFEKGKWSMNSRPKSVSVDQLPAPNAYVPNDHATTAYKNRGAFSILSRKIGIQAGSEVTPSPADYNPVTQRVGGITIGSRRKQLKEFSSPGPAAYSPDVKPIRQAGPSWSIKKRQAVTHDNKNLQPSPADYDPTNGFRANRPNAPAYSLGSRHSIENENDIPGPGHYNPSSQIGHRGDLSPKGGPKWSLKETKSRSSRAVSPAPNAYFPKQSTTNKNKWSLGQRLKISAKKDVDLPAPNIYNPNDSSLSRYPRKSSFTFGFRLKDTISESFPSPADYAPQMKEKRDGFTMGKRLKRKQKSAGPGPGAYELPPASEVKRSFKFTSRRKSRQNNDVPGTYKIWIKYYV